MKPSERIRELSGIEYHEYSPGQIEELELKVSAIIRYLDESSNAEHKEG